MTPRGGSPQEITAGRKRRFPVKPRKGRIRQMADPSSRNWSFHFQLIMIPMHEFVSAFAGRSVKGEGNQSSRNSAAQAAGYADGRRCPSTGRTLSVAEQV